MCLAVYINEYDFQFQARSITQQTYIFRENPDLGMFEQAHIYNAQYYRTQMKMTHRIMSLLQMNETIASHDFTYNCTRFHRRNLTNLDPPKK